MKVRKKVEGDLFIPLMKCHRGRIVFIGDQDGETWIEYHISWFDELMLSLHIQWIEKRAGY